MKLGMLTACLPDVPLFKIADWAADHGFEALEVAVWPDVPGRAFEASHVDVTNLAELEAETIRRHLEDRGLFISALAYYENNLHPDAATREAHHAHLRACIDAAPLLGTDLVGTFVGRDWNLSVIDNLRLAEGVLPPLIGYAAERGVKLIVENCPMEGWHPDGYPANLAYAPELWEWMCSLGLYLNYDPSHLIWLGIDPVRALKDFAPYILHAQAKDIEIFPDGRDRVGIYGRVVGRKDPWDNGWWRYRVPGRGSIDWNRIVDALYEAGFEGVLSVEHEDPIWSGDPIRVFSGLAISKDALRPLIRRRSDDFSVTGSELER